MLKTDCHDDLNPRLHYSGDYEKHECSITISSLELEDAGSWICEVSDKSIMFMRMIIDLEYFRWRVMYWVQRGDTNPKTQLRSLLRR